MVREWRQLWTIPALAAFVGWFTNWVAVRMIFAPLQFVGIPIRVPQAESARSSAPPSRVVFQMNAADLGEAFKRRRPSLTLILKTC